jgi:hypothetical protein
MAERKVEQTGEVAQARVNRKPSFARRSTCGI